MVDDAVIETISRDADREQTGIAVQQRVGRPKERRASAACSGDARRTYCGRAAGTAPQRRATLATIAAEAGVSLPTVSKVVNGRPDVAAATRARVERLLDAAPVHPGRVAARQRRSGLIDLVFNGLDSPWAVEILRGVEEWGADHETAVAVSAVRHGNARPASWTSALASHDTDGVILVTSELTEAQLEQLRSAGIPLVVVDPVNPPPPDLASVGATNWAGGPGRHRAPARPGPPPDRRHRRPGGLPVQPGPDRRVPFGPGAGRRRRSIGRWCGTATSSTRAASSSGGELLDLADRPTAIFSGNDQQALGVYEAARQRGLRIPQDLSVVGFDDLPVARWVSPPLTTVRQPLAEMGRAAAQMLGELIEGRAAAQPAGGAVHRADHAGVRPAPAWPARGDPAARARRTPAPARSGATRSARPPNGSRTCSAG